MALDDSDFRFRPNQVGGSEVSIIIGLNPWMTAAALLAEKRLGAVQEVTPQRHRIMRCGKVLEDQVIDWYRQLHPDRIIDSITREPEFAIRAADSDSIEPAIILSHPDAVFVERGRSPNQKLLRVIEVKTTTGRRKDISHDHCPDEYRVQTQMEMHGAHQTGQPCSTTDVVCYNLSNGDMYVWPIAYDRNFCEQTVAYVAQWKRDYLDSDRPTEELVRELATGKDEVATILDLTMQPGRRLIGDDEKEVGHAVEQLSRYVKAKEAENAWRGEATQARNLLANMCDDRAGLAVFGKPVLTYSQIAGRTPGNPQITTMANGMMASETVAKIADEMAGHFIAAGITQDDLSTALAPALTRAVADVAATTRESSRTESSRRLTVRETAARDLIADWNKVHGKGPEIVQER